jgi:hypothetical protein
MGPELVRLMAALRKELSLNSFHAVALAGSLLDCSQPGTPERLAFERIASALNSFDFPGAASALNEVMVAAGIAVDDDAQ